MYSETRSESIAANSTATPTAAEPRVSARREFVRGPKGTMAVLVATVLALLATLLTANPASATEGPVLLRPGTRCWPANTSGVALIGVDPPQLRPMPSSTPVYVGADNQTVKYQAYLQRWNGTSWVTMTGGTGPLFTGTTNYYTTTFPGSTGGWTGWNISRQATRQHYRVTAQIWWIADSTHSGAYSSGVADMQQYDPTQGWQYVSYCTY